ncbi:MAG: hypothetical protein AAF405_05575 [Pseudomonadota bacterium]
MTKRITSGATILMGLIAVFWICWLGIFSSRAATLVMSQEAWRPFDMTENHAEISLFARVAFSCLSIGIILVGTATFWAAFRMCNLVKRGEYFTDRTTHALSVFGWLLVASMAYDTLFAAVDHSIYTWDNSSESITLDDGSISVGRPFIAPRYEYAPAIISQLLCGLGFALIGHVLTVARKLEDEARSYV